MSLNFDTRKCTPPTPSDEAENLQRQAIVFLTMVCKMGKITQDNWREFYTRAHYWESHFGAFRQEGEKSIFLQPGEVKRWIGLETNVQNDPRTTYIKFVASQIKHDLLTIDRKTKEME